ncbi:MAG: hypothetical protein JWM11_6550 [Planctomycetaceae bacterium]|nr:hypothetical protein [Planctomycetaceae bacterium]
MSEPVRWIQTPRFLAFISLGLCVAIGIFLAAVGPRHAKFRNVPEEVSSLSPDVRDPRQVSNSQTSVKAAKIPEQISAPIRLAAVQNETPAPRFKKEGPNGALRISFTDLDPKEKIKADLNSLELLRSLPENLRQLNGVRIRIRGYMHPGSAFQETGIERFILVRDTSAMNLGADYARASCEMVIVKLIAGTSTDFSENRAIDLEGNFRIEPVVHKSSDRVEELYHLDDAVVLQSNRSPN